MNNQLDNQFFELDADLSGQEYGQTIKLASAGEYLLQFDYEPRAGQSFKENSFKVYFNGRLVVDIHPGDMKRHHVVEVVEGVAGENRLVFLDVGVENNYGCGVDNVGLYKVNYIA